MDGREMKGKQKRENKKVKSNRDLLITFSKRKYGIHKKASELSTLCGAKVDILMFTSSGNWFSYGEPSHQAMARSSDEESPIELVEVHTKSEINELNAKNNALMSQIYYEKKREDELDAILKTKNPRGWWEPKIQDLSREQAMETEASFVEFKKKLENELSIKHREKENNASQGEALLFLLLTCLYYLKKTYY
uniref:Agamous-like MADS-box protein AGL62 n=1 Tax=Cajanus cajan TaxID=3821 RepID=A0A151S4C1_CAJCA|nr:Agamous-like MADS-box protein AGL62 [Cajanus cajan]